MKFSHECLDFSKKLATGLLSDLVKGGIRLLDRTRQPVLDGTFKTTGLDGPVEIIRDRFAVPHIYASSVRDAFFAQGFVHAQDRMCQMELNRRFGHGRLSEIFGAAALPLDKAARVLGFRQTALIDLENSSEELKSALEAYSDGVNCWRTNSNYKTPVELALVGAPRPQAWSPLDCMVFARLMIWQLCRGWSSEIVRAKLYEAVGAEKAAELEITESPANPIHLPGGIEVSSLGPNVLDNSGPRGMGSNAWAVTPKLASADGAILSNDMHLPLMLPSFWYQVHLVSGDLNVAGVSLPGLPMVMGGHNSHIAWGITLAHTDAEDTYIEKFNPDNPRLYEFRGQWKSADVRREIIKVRGRRKPEVVDVITTVHGPVVTEILQGVNHSLTLRSTALEPAKAADGWLRLNLAQNWDQFVDAMALIESPPLNVTYADVLGNIGYWCAGKVPIRAAGDGMLPADGWSGDAEWKGFIPFNEMPHTLNPAKGFVVSCNQPIIGPDYPYWTGGVFMNGARARRVEQFIKAATKGRKKMSLEDCRTLQGDVLCLSALDLIKRLQKIESEDPDFLMVMQFLNNWDGQMHANSVAACIYEVLRFNLAKGLLEPNLGPELTLHLMGEGFNPSLNQTNEFYGHDTATIIRVLDNPKSKWVPEDGKTLWVVNAAKTAINYLKQRLGEAPELWEWGRIHGAVFSHLMGSQPPMDAIFNIGPLPVGGNSDTPNQTAMMPKTAYQTTAWAATFRQIIDTGDWSKCMTIHAPGQAGQPASPHYDDYLQMWLKGELNPMLWTREQVENHAAHRLHLK